MTQQLGMFDPKPVAQETRKEAYRALTPKKVNAGHQRVLAALRAHPAGLIDEEIVALTGLSANTERPRRGELVELALVKEAGTRRPTKSGCLAAVWVLDERAGTTP